MVVVLSGYECMVEAFHLLNEPNDRAVYTGMAILAMLFLLVPIALWRLWRKIHVNVR
jgi:hypothetical protein